MKTTAAILAAALAFAGAAQAQSVKSTVRVSYADLDLSRGPGRAMLESRIKRAIAQVCPEDSDQRPLSQAARQRQCREQAWIAAREQIAAIYDGRSLADSAVQIRTASR